VSRRATCVAPDRPWMPRPNRCYAARMRISLARVGAALGLVLVGCGGASVEPRSDAGDDGSLGGIGPGTCLAGATELDCQRCGAPGSGCERACPSVDCSVYPPAPECTSLCGKDTCCACTPSFGNEYLWLRPQSAIVCGTPCSDMYARWQASMAEPAMKACTSPADCTLVGGQPSLDPCNGHSTVGGCGVPANAAAYQGSPAAALEIQYFNQCPRATMAFDCGLGSATCLQGRCVVYGFACCNCPPPPTPDAAIRIDASPASLYGGKG
jgi:hypothetical protein